MLALDNILLLALIVLAMALFISEKLRADVVALCVLVALLVLRLIEPEQALFGFANQATGIVAAMFVLSAGLVRTGIVAWLARRIDRIAGRSKTQLLLVLCLTSAVLSAFIVNTAIVAIFLPVAFALSQNRKLPVSKILIPVAFASQLGGVCTLIGSSTNILVNSIAVDSGGGGFQVFEFARLGLILMGIGLIYLIVISGKLLPKRKAAYQQIDKYRLADYLAEFTVAPGSKLNEKRWEELTPQEVKNIRLIKLIRDQKAVSHPQKTVIREADILLVYSDADKLMKFKDHFGLQSKADEVIDDKKVSSEDIKLVEGLIPPGSRLQGRTLKGSNFRRIFRCAVLAVQRRGKVIREQLENIRFEPGDTLLLQCDKEKVQDILRSSDLVVTNELTELQLRRNKAFIALGLLAAVVTLAALNIIPILTAVLIGVVGLLLSGCLTLDEAYQAIDWKVIFLLGGILPLGLALQQTGTAQWLANILLEPLADLGPIFVLASLYFVTAVLTEGMSNVATAILLAPIALSLASGMGVNPQPFLIAITFAASTSFATPIGYQTNMMVHGPGGYRFTDFSRVGIPLNLVFWAVSVFLIPLFWPF
jgi:di/tricarboxylate transporter